MWSNTARVFLILPTNVKVTATIFRPIPFKAKNNCIIPFLPSSSFIWYLSYVLYQNVNTMERLDKGHLRPKLEVPQLTCQGRESNLGLHRKRGMRIACLIAIRNLYMVAPVDVTITVHMD